MCDFPHYNPGHNCQQFPTLKIEQCELCGLKTCGYTRPANVMSGEITQPWTICLYCSTEATRDPWRLAELQAIIRQRNPRVQFN